jgi:hypothetical protein
MKLSTSLSLCIFLSCVPANTPAPTSDASAPSSAAVVEAGAQVVNGACNLLTGWTSNQTVITLCATAEDIIDILGFFAQHKLLGRADAGEVCTVIPTTQVCATKRELGDAISFVLTKRSARYVRDAGGDQ